MNDTWINDKGNFCVHIADGEEHKTMWHIKLIFIGFISSFFLSCLWKEWILFIAIPVLFIASYIAYRAQLNKEHKRDEILLSLLKEQINIQLETFISKQTDNVTEKRRIVFYQTQGTYGIVKGIFILCLLSNGEVIEYELIRHCDETRGFYELSNMSVVCTEEERLKSVIPYYGFRKLFGRLKLSPESKLIAFILLILFISTFFVGLFVGAIFLWKKWVLVGMICLIILFTFRDYISTKIKALNLFFNILIQFVAFALKICHPAFVIYGAIFATLIYLVGIPLIVIKILAYCFELELNNSTQLFLILTFIEIICVHFPIITRYIIKQSPFNNWRNHKYEQYQEELAIYVVSPKISNLIFSILYFLFLFVNAFKQLQLHSPLISENVDNAILKSFLVFLAFSAMKQKNNEADIKAEDILGKIGGLFLHDYDKRELNDIKSEKNENNKL